MSLASAPLTDTGYAKINLALHVRARRPDGYHELETLFAFAEAGDVLTASPADALGLTITGPFGDGLSSEPDNLVLRAVRLLAEENDITPQLAFTLEKNLPIAAGIGGGSADAAAALRLAQQFWGLGEGAVLPEDIALRLGADVPACLVSQTCQGTGVGEQLSPAPELGLSGLPILLVNPRRACPTGPVFQAWDGVDRGPLLLDHWRDGRNDLEPSACALVSEIGDIVTLLRDQPGVTLARMSGSGATCFALFADIADRDAACQAIESARPDWWVLPSRLR
jgi:4-diphosphocytidyl-2-C-methyl-D-erythritol kinase